MVINITIPRKLIKEFLPHPEPYGEACVVLVNGMYTDIYTSDEGEIFTPTNDQLLIEYLRLNGGYVIDRKNADV